MCTKQIKPTVYPLVHTMVPARSIQFISRQWCGQGAQRWCLPTPQVFKLSALLIYTFLRARINCYSSIAASPWIPPCIAFRACAFGGARQRCRLTNSHALLAHCHICMYHADVPQSLIEQSIHLWCVAEKPIHLALRLLGEASWIGHWADSFRSNMPTVFFAREQKSHV